MVSLPCSRSLNWGCSPSVSRNLQGGLMSWFSLIFLHGLEKTLNLQELILGLTFHSGLIWHQISLVSFCSSAFWFLFPTFSRSVFVITAYRRAYCTSRLYYISLELSIYMKGSKSWAIGTGKPQTLLHLQVISFCLYMSLRSDAFYTPKRLWNANFEHFCY